MPTWGGGSIRSIHIRRRCGCVGLGKDDQADPSSREETPWKGFRASLVDSFAFLLDGLYRFIPRIEGIHPGSKPDPLSVEMEEGVHVDAQLSTPTGER